MNKKTYLIVGGLAAALVILYLLFKGSSSSSASLPIYSTAGSGTSLASLLSSPGLSGALTNATSSLEESIDSIGDLNDPGITSGPIGASNQPGILTAPLTTLDASTLDSLNSPGLLSTPSLGVSINPCSDDFTYNLD